VRALSFVEIESSEPASVVVALSMTSEHATLTWRDGGEVRMTASLPAGSDDARVTLRPQRGLRNVEAALHEIHVEDEAVDAAWVIHGSEPALLLAAVPELRALARFEPSVDVDGAKLTVAFARIDDADAIAVALALWHRAAFFRMGVS
jgi:hypothetical protein